MSFFAFKVAPGVRVRVSKHGVRTSIGPRSARVHVGGGYRPGVSTGAGPFTLYHSIGSTKKRRGPASRGRTGTRRASTPRLAGRPAVAPRGAAAPRASATNRAAASLAGTPGGRNSARGQQSQLHAVAKSTEAKQLTAAFAAIASLPRGPFIAVTPPVGPDPEPIDEGAVTARHQAAARAGLHWWQRAERQAAAKAAKVSAAAEVAQARIAAQADADRIQADLDTTWAGLLANDPHIVLGTLAEAFETHGDETAVLATVGDEITLAVVVGPETMIPERKPGTTPSGSLSLTPLSASERALWYTEAVCGHVLASVREAFTVAPALGRARVAAVRLGPIDVYGHHRLECVLAAVFARSALEHVAWAQVDAATIVFDVGTDVVVHQAGQARHLGPIDLSGQPELAGALAAFDLDHPEGTAP